MENLSFEQVTNLIDSIEVPVQRLGIFDVLINNRGKRYDFYSLKQTFSYNKNVIGFSLNHYNFSAFPKNKFKGSKFHDEEDVDINLKKSEFVRCDKISNNHLYIKMKTFSIDVKWK